MKWGQSEDCPLNQLQSLILSARDRRQLAEPRQQVLRLAVMPYADLDALAGSVVSDQQVEVLRIRYGIAVELADHVARPHACLVGRRSDDHFFHLRSPH